MKKEQEMVREFMLKAGQDCPKTPTLEPLQSVKDLRYNLIWEELQELWNAMYDCNRIGIADSIGDLLVVVLGTAVAFGMDIEPIFNEIHRSNMTKFIDGHKREDGKWVKGPSYSPANLEPIIKAQQNSSPH